MPDEPITGLDRRRQGLLPYKRTPKLKVPVPWVGFARQGSRLAARRGITEYAITSDVVHRAELDIGQTERISPEGETAEQANDELDRLHTIVLMAFANSVRGSLFGVEDFGFLPNIEPGERRQQP